MTSITISRTHAIELNQKWYFTGQPCERGHIAKRGVKGRICYECQRTRSATFRKQNPEYHHEYNVQYYPNNKERIAKLSNAYYAKMRQENPELLKHRQDVNHLKYRVTHRQEFLEREKKWRNENPAKANRRNVNRRTRRLNATPKWIDIQKIWNIYEQCAAINKISTTKHEVDHIVPLQGKTVCGLHVDYNLRIITKSENSKKHNKLLEQEIE